MDVERRHVALVLAAGGSRRLGTPKQLLRRNGETLVHRAARIAAATYPERLLIVIGAYAEEVRSAVADLDAELLFNADWALGLASSLSVAQRALSAHTGATLIVGCDQPALELEHVQGLLRAACNAKSGSAATLHENGPGIPAVITAAIWASAGKLQGDRGLGAMLRALPMGALGLLDAPELGRDIDDACDLQAAIALKLIDPD